MQFQILLVPISILITIAKIPQINMEETATLTFMTSKTRLLIVVLARITDTRICSALETTIVATSHKLEGLLKDKTSMAKFKKCDTFISLAIIKIICFTLLNGSSIKISSFLISSRRLMSQKGQAGSEAVIDYFSQTCFLPFWED